MDAQMIFIVGGQRSGKSRYALNLGEGIENKAFLATAPYIDEEMNSRIQRHKREREENSWVNLETELELKPFLEKEFDFLLLDCLTLWINNLFYHGKVSGEDDILPYLERAFSNFAAKKLVVVSNEIGWGGISESRKMRDFVDILCRANQWVAKQADEVILMSCGLPLVLKS